MSAISVRWLYVGWGAVTFETNYGLMQQSPPEIKEKLLKALDKEYNVVDMVTVLEIVSLLEKTPITKEALETTRLGKYINELRRKTTNDALAKRAKDLVRRWRDMILPPTETTPQHNGSARLPATSTSSNRGSGGPTQPRPGVISPVVSIPSTTTSPALSQPSRGDAVPKTHASNKRLRKETSPSDKPPAKMPRLNGSTFRPDVGECSRDSSDRASDVCEIISVVTKAVERPLGEKKKGRKKGSKNHLGKEISQASSDDIVKEKIASIARTPRVKTTQELLADLKSKTDGTLPADNRAEANCGLPHTQTDELTRNKTEHIAKFLRSQSEVVNDDSIDVIKTNQEELRPGTESLPSHSTVGPAQSSRASSTVPPSPAPEESVERTVEEILSRLPPLDLEAIQWDESQSPPSSPPPPCPVTEDDVLRLHTEHIECLNGCADHSGLKTSKGDEGFSEWHEVVSRTSYNGELLHILPYCVID